MTSKESSNDEMAQDDDLQLPDSTTSQNLSGIECHLDTTELWKKFHELGTEMIITKSGRRMFPTLRVKFSGVIKSNDLFTVLMDIIPVDNKRYRYAYHKSMWLVAGKSDTLMNRKLFPFNERIIEGNCLKNHIISFERVKLTNNFILCDKQIILNSMHRYQPRIHLVQLNSHKSKQFPSTYHQLQKYEHKTFVFHETEFIAVTAYQNQLITQLKINSNPFAKGFRDTSKFSEYERSIPSSSAAVSSPSSSSAVASMQILTTSPQPFLLSNNTMTNNNNNNQNQLNFHQLYQFYYNPLNFLIPISFNYFLSNFNGLSNQEIQHEIEQKLFLYREFCEKYNLINPFLINKRSNNN